HVAHPEPVKAAIAAREPEYRHRPSAFVARLHGVHVSVEDDVTSRARLTDTGHEIGRPRIARDRLAGDAVRLKGAADNPCGCDPGAGRGGARSRYKSGAELDQLLAAGVDFAFGCLGKVSAHRSAASAVCGRETQDRIRRAARDLRVDHRISSTL